MAILALVLVVTASLGLSACGDGRYELKEERTGRLVRLDRWLGGVAVLEGNTLVETLDPGALANLARGRSWPDRTIAPLGGSTFSLRTSWRAGALHYRLSIRPLSQRLTDALAQPNPRNSFTLSFVDSEGFSVAEVAAALSAFTRVVDDTGTLVALETDARYPIASDHYSLATAWRVRWNLSEASAPR